MKRTAGKIVAALCVICMIFSVCAPVYAKADKGKKKKVKTEKTAVLKVKKTTCTSAGKVNISFKDAVEWDQDAAVTVKDAEGAELKASFVKKNRKLAAVAVEGMVKGQKYTVQISGVKAAGAEEYAAVECEFTAKKLKTAVRTEKPAVSKNFVIIKFKGKAVFKDIAVTLADEGGSELAAKIVKKTKSQIRISTEGLEHGKKYTVTVNGVKLKKEKNFGSVVRTFTIK